MTEIILSLTTGLSVGFVVGYFVRKVYFRGKIEITADYIGGMQSTPIFKCKGDVDATITAEKLEVNPKGITF